MEDFRFVSVVHVFMIKNGELLLMRRWNTGHEDGKYGVPSGRLEGGEEIRSAAVREVKEECGVDIQEEDLSMVGVMHIKSEDERIDFFFVTNRWSGEITNAEPHKCDDMRWFRTDHFPDNLIPYVRMAWDQYGKRTWFSSYGWN
ncbi:NUDIX hydrolase [Paenibacillus medicaginis]|uniref:NUDIX domain-containing protein n=1 Tax=Paenibacillus medicaginis TaxID=1470560 RepID=A0ABV5C3P6_9BACL